MKLEMKYYKKVWAEVEDGGSGQWLYVHEFVAKKKAEYKGAPSVKVPTGEYAFIRIIDLPEYCGKDADCLFSGSLQFVNLLDVPKSQLHGWKAETYSNFELALILQSYGIASLCEFGAGKPTGYAHDKHPAFKQVRSYLHKQAKFLFSKEGRQDAADTIVNPLGQTLKQFNAGADGLFEKLYDIKVNGGDESQNLILKMYSKCDVTLGGDKIPENIK